MLEKSTVTGKDGEDTDSRVPRVGFAGSFPSRCVGERRATGGGGGGEILSGRLRPLFCPGQVSVRFYLWLRYFLVAAHCHATALLFGNAERISQIQSPRFFCCNGCDNYKFALVSLNAVTNVFCLMKAVLNGVSRLMEMTSQKQF